VSCKNEANKASHSNSVSNELFGVQEWFTAWELTCKEIFPLLETKAPDFVFFDEQYVYSTSKITIPNGVSIKGPLLFGETLGWLKNKHDGSITLPDGQEVSIGLMSFASPIENQKKASFFVMALPKFWKSAGVESEELGIEKMLTGVFLHEFSHTQQMQNFGRKISEYELQYNFESELSDDIVQQTFEGDSTYVNEFKDEVEMLFNLNKIEIDSTFFDSTQNAIAKIRKRQAHYFKDDNAIFQELDDFFLTMEGVGQYTFYKWMIHPKGGNLSKEIALKGTRRGGTFWSQDEGLALCLLLDKTSKKDWTLQMFRDEPKSVISLIENIIAKK